MTTSTTPAWRLGEAKSTPPPASITDRTDSSDDPFSKIVRDNFGVDAFELRARSSESSEASANLLVGHFTPFGEWAEIRSRIEGHFLEQVQRGAFRRSFAEHKPKVLFQHGRDPSLGKQIIGDVLRLEEDERGAAYAVQLFEGVPELIVSGFRAGVYGASFTFDVVREEYDPAPARSAHNPRKLPERTIVEATVYEFGPVTWPAYEGATAGIGSFSNASAARKSQTWRL
jgi:hypothetical protein